jgi:hypothetical protein
MQMCALVRGQGEMSLAYCVIQFNVLFHDAYPSCSVASSSDVNFVVWFYCLRQIIDF